MPPKKAVKEEKILLGRPGNNLKAGIVGLANVGKSTLFQAITKCSLGNPANFPYATIDPEESRVIVPDDRFDWLVDQYKPKSQVPAHLTIYDIAGLTRGSSTGAGLGNAFLSHIRAVDAIFQVVRCFDDAEIIHIEGDVNPVRDLEIISEELRTKDIEFVEKAHENLVKQTRRGGQSLEMRKLKEEQATVEKILEGLKEGKDVRKGDWTPKEVEVINPLFLLTAKPVVYLINLSEKDYIRQKNKNLPAIAKWVKENQADNAANDPIIPVSICLEERLTRFENDADANAELEKIGTKSALPKIVTTMRKSMNLGSFFTTGTDEVRQWTIRNGTKAPQAAGVIHGDFEKTFIQAVVYNFAVLKEEGDEGGVKAKGKIMTKGKDYVVEDGGESVCSSFYPPIALTSEKTYFSSKLVQQRLDTLRITRIRISQPQPRHHFKHHVNSSLVQDVESTMPEIPHLAIFVEHDVKYEDSSSKSRDYRPGTHASISIDPSLHKSAFGVA